MPFAALHINQERWERIAQTLAAVVREQCAQACEAQREPVNTDMDVAYDDAVDDCIAAIRIMK